MITRQYQIRVRYKDTDAMGFVHHSNYVNFYESARTEMLRQLGTTYKEMEGSGVMMPVLEVGMKYYTPARYDDLLTVTIRLDELPKARISFDHEIRNESGELVNTGRVVLAFMNHTTRRACRAPQWFIDILAANADTPFG